MIEHDPYSHLQAPFVLEEEEIHLWRISLDRPAGTLGRLELLLSADEARRAGRFRFTRDRDRFIVGRAALRQILGRYRGVPPGSVAFLYGEHGKPSLGEQQSPLYFNLAHSHGLAICGVTRGGEIGVDVEHIVPLEDALQIAGSFFSRYEQAELRQLPADRINEGFFNCWTRKEAFVKLKGEGLSHPLDTFDVSLAPDEPARILASNGSPEEGDSWMLYSLKPETGYVAAVAVGRGEWRLMEMEWRSDLP